MPDSTQQGHAPKTASNDNGPYGTGQYLAECSCGVRVWSGTLKGLLTDWSKHVIR